MPLVAPTLVVADGASGGAFTATLAGGDSGATNTLYVSQMTGNVGAMGQTSVGMRTGNGTIAGTLAVGFYVWQVKSVLGTEQAWSPPYYQRISSAADSIHEQLQQDAVARCLALALPGINSRVMRKKLPPGTRQANLPDHSLMLLTFDQTEDYTLASSNGHDDTKLPLYLVMTSGDLLTDKADSDVTLCRQLLRRAFREYRSSVSGHYRTELNQGIVLGVADGERTLQGSSLGLNFVVRENRGLGA